MKSSAKFFLLHIACAFRRPKNWRFHAAGALREIGRLQPALRAVIFSSYCTGTIASLGIAVIGSH
jgi:hypothetical protein